MTNKTSKQNFPFGKIVLIAIIYTVIAQILHTIGAMATMSFYLDPRFHQVWSKLMMPTAGPPPLSFTLTSLAISFIIGIIFASVYAIIKNGLTGKTNAKKGLFYGLLVFFIAGVPFFFTLFLLINLPVALLVYWLFEGLIIYLLLGLITAKIIK